MCIRIWQLGLGVDYDFVSQTLISIQCELNFQGFIQIRTQIRAFNVIIIIRGEASFPVLFNISQTDSDGYGSLQSSKPKSLNLIMRKKNKSQPRCSWSIKNATRLTFVCVKNPLLPCAIVLKLWFSVGAGILTVIRALKFDMEGVSSKMIKNTMQAV